MEARKITIVSTKDQKKSVIMSAATNLSELKADLRQNSIDYNGMTFYEGISKTELKDDSSVLPHDVPWRGQVTNELVFMLTNTNKKIRSGAMNRAEAYAAIKANNLQAECVKKFGKNFTQCATADLISLVEKASKKVTSAPVSETAKPVNDSVKEEKKGVSVEVEDISARAAIAKLVDYLYDAGDLEVEEKEHILNILAGRVEDTSKPCESSNPSPYSDRDIEDMFNFVE